MTDQCSLSTLEVANDFADQFQAVAARKEDIVRLLFATFPEIPGNRAALEYIDSVTGSRQSPIPWFDRAAEGGSMAALFG
jgi:hypothetical protein